MDAKKYVWGKKAKGAAKASNAQIIKNLDAHIRDMERLIPLSYNEQLFRYLHKTYEYGRRHLMVKNDPDLQAELLRRVPKTRMKGGFNRFRILLELQSPDFPSRKQRQRHARALLAAHKAKIHSSELRAFVQKAGGWNALGDQRAKKPTARSDAKRGMSQTSSRSNRPKEVEGDDDWGVSSDVKFNAEKRKSDWS
ncbi:MAG: hypothetical protein AB7P20_07965 [Rhizobiaceae bacterium]